MKITVEAVYSCSSNYHLGKEVYFNNEFMGCIGYGSKLEFETENIENELKLIDCIYDKKISMINFTATEDVYFWIVKCASALKGPYTKIYGKGKDYKLISEIKE